MTIKDYYDILGLPLNAGIDEIKKAYRKKAYQYHPDINHTPGAKDMFVSITEAYEFLMSNHDRIESEFQEAMENWRKYRQDLSRRRANTYAAKSYYHFRRSQLYRTTRIFEGTRTIYSLILSLLIIAYTIFGYTYRLNHPWRGEKPSIFAFILLLFIGLIFLAVSAGYLRSWIKKSHKNRDKRA